MALAHGPLEGAGVRAPGCILAIARRGRLESVRYSGWADIENRILIDADTRFRVASITKHFTATVMMMLVKEGKVDRARKVSDYLPQYPELPISIDNLLRHRSGLPDYTDLIWLAGGLDLECPPGPLDIDAMLYRSRHLSFTPGRRYLYGNTGHWLLGRIIEAVDGRPLAEAFRRRIFAPFGLTNTGLVESDAAGGDVFAAGYSRASGGVLIQARPYFPLGGAAGVVSCLRDLVQWSCELEQGSLGFAPAPVGLKRRAWSGLQVIGHDGNLPGYRAEFWRAPECGVTVIVLANSDSQATGAAARAAMLDAVGLRDEPAIGACPAFPSGSYGAMPEDLPGTYVCADAGAVWEVGQGVRMAGFLSRLDRPPAELHPIGRDLVEVARPGFPRPRRCVARLARCLKGGVHSLVVSTSRSHLLRFVKARSSMNAEEILNLVCERGWHRTLLSIRSPCQADGDRDDA